MKRSEATNMIYYYFRIQGHGQDHCTKYAEEILDGIEKMGMLPPYRPSDKKTIRCQVSEWEPEDET